MSKSDDIELQERLLSAPDTPASESSNPFDKPLPNLPSPLTPSHEDTSHEHAITHKGHTVRIHSLNWRDSPLLRAQILICFFLFILDGAADQTVGTLMSYLVKHYDTTQTHISIIFMLQFLGYCVSALANELLHQRFGKLGVLICATLSMTLCFAVNSMTDVLGVYIAVHVFYGLGAGLSASSVNVYISGLVNHNEIMGILHGSYGIGSVVSPPCVSWILAKWGYKYYYGILATSGVIGLVLVLMFFKDETKWKYDYLTTKDDEEGTVKRSFFSLAVDPLVLCFCLYLFFYVGAEISIGSWLLTYLRETKGMKQMEAAIVVSWFWIGLTTGRVVLGFFTKCFSNEYRANMFYTMISWVSFCVFMIFAAVYMGANFVWISKLLVFICGVFVGPLYPTGSVVLMKILPVHLQVLALGICGSLGGSGSAVLPFLVGVIGRAVGFQYLLFIMNFTLVAYCIAWLVLPKAAKKAGYTF